jgi:Tol biopolymer transport system component
MYFAAEVNGESHLWRQRFSDGSPEQLTRGVNQEWGVTVDPNGRSLITSVGNTQSTVWYHDEKGDRPLSVEGYAYRPLLSPDGSQVFYLVRKVVRGSVWSGEVWSVDLTSGRNERLLPDFLVQYYHVSHDGKTIVFDAFDQSGRSKVWIAPVDRNHAPRRLTPEGGADDQHPMLGSSGDVYFVRSSGNQRFFFRMKPDGSAREELRDVSGQYLLNLSPDEKWAAFWQGGPGVLFCPLGGGPARSLCECNAGPIYQDSPRVAWSGDGKLLIVNAGGSMAGLGTTVIPWRGADTLPSARALTGPELRRLPGATQLDETSVAPGRTLATYAFARAAEQSNLYRVRLQ